MAEVKEGSAAFAKKRVPSGNEPPKLAYAPTKSLSRQILALKANPAIQTHTQIAEILGVSNQTVTRHVKALEADIEQANSKLDEYQRVFLGSFAITDRANRLIELAKQSESPHVALQSLLRLDDLDGIVTEKDRLRAINQPSSHEFNTPMFMLMPGSNVSVRMTKDGHSAGTVELQVSDSKDQDRGSFDGQSKEEGTSTVDNQDQAGTPDPPELGLRAQEDEDPSGGKPLPK